MFKLDRITNDNTLPGGGKGHPFWSCRLWWQRGYVQWLAGHKAKSCAIEYGHDHGESKHMIHLAVPWLFNVFVVWDAARSPGYDNHRWGLSIHHGSIWWAWRDTDDWHHGQPWWQAFSINPVELLLGRTRMHTTTLSTSEEQLPLPEGPVAVTVELVYSVWRRSRWPFAVHKRYGAEVTAVDPDGIPAPGKGENSWDCGDNNIQQLSCEARSVAEALGATLASVLDTRMRYGGSHEYTPTEGCLAQSVPDERKEGE